MLSPGLGFTYLGFVGWHLAWYGIGFFAALPWVFSYPASPTLSSLIAILAWGICQIHYAWLFNRLILRNWKSANYLAVAAMGLASLVLGFLPAFLIYELSDKSSSHGYLTAACAMDITQKEAAYMIDHKAYANASQLLGEYHPNCHKSLEVISLTVQDKYNYSILVLSEQGEYIYLANREGIHKIKGNDIGRQ